MRSALWPAALLPLLAAAGSGDFNLFDLAALGLWFVGFGFEALGDRQLARLRADPSNAGRVLDSGLWRYTRHPNYFGECCIWWSYCLFALGAGRSNRLTSSAVMITRGVVWSSLRNSLARVYPARPLPTMTMGSTGYSPLSCASTSCGTSSSIRRAIFNPF